MKNSDFKVRREPRGKFLIISLFIRLENSAMARVGVSRVQTVATDTSLTHPTAMSNIFFVIIALADGAIV